MAIFDIGETVICSVEVRNSAGTLVDPATSMKIGIDQTHPIFRSIIAISTDMTKDSTGKYHYDFDSSTATTGNYKVIYKATDGTRITIERETFTLE